MDTQDDSVPLEEMLRAQASRPLPIINVQSSSAMLALAVFVATKDAALAEKVIVANLSPAALIQAEPHLPDEAMEVLEAHKEVLCGALKLPTLQHCKRRVDEDDEAEPRKVGGRALHDAAYLTGSRLRVSLTNASPHFWRDKQQQVVCNGCLAPLGIKTNEELRDALYAPAWSQMRWKTFLCAKCRERAGRLPDADACYSCWHAKDGRVWIPLRYAEVDKPDTPRLLPLCGDCKARSGAQLATVTFVAKPQG